MQYKESLYNIRVPLLGGRALWYNAASRSLVLMEPEDLAAVRPEHLQSDDHFASRPTSSYLLGQGFILPADVDEKGLLRQQYLDTRHDPSVVNLIVCSTLACNFGCDYCFQGVDKPADVMTDDVKGRIVALYERLLAARPETRMVNMVWYGGEPLMRKQIVYDLAERLIDVSARAGILYTGTMVTNGFLLTKEVAETLFLKGLRTVQITLDGDEELHDARRHLLSEAKKGTYWKIMKNLASWIDEVPISVHARVNIDERNKDAITHLVDDLVERGLSGKRNFKLYFSPVETSTTACHSVADLTMKKVAYGRLEASLYRYAFDRGLASLPYPTRFLGICSAVRPNDYLVVPNGDVHKCWDTVSFPEKRVGTVFDTEALFLKADPNHQKWESFDPFANEICHSCKILPNCTSYCAHKFVYAHDAKGDSVLPCPSLKYSLNERLVLRAEKEGIITAADYDEEAIRTNPFDLTPRMHTEESMRRRRLPLAVAAG
jgi:uncharacterized protein